MIHPVLLGTQYPARTTTIPIHIYRSGRCVFNPKSQFRAIPGRPLNGHLSSEIPGIDITLLVLELFITELFTLEFCRIPRLETEL
jgi:hypothetical protein